MKRTQFKKALTTKTTSSLKMNLASIQSKMKTAIKGSKEIYILNQTGLMIANELNNRCHFIAQTECIKSLLKGFRPINIEFML